MNIIFIKVIKDSMLNERSGVYYCIYTTNRNGTTLYHYIRDGGSSYYVSNTHHRYFTNDIFEIIKLT